MDQNIIQQVRELHSELVDLNFKLSRSELGSLVRLCVLHEQLKELAQSHPVEARVVLLEVHSHQVEVAKARRETARAIDESKIGIHLIASAQPIYYPEA